MALVELNLKPTDRQLRQFGTASLVMLCILGLLLWRLEKITFSAAAVFCLAGGSLFLLSRIRALLIRPVYQALMLLTFPIGWAVSHAAMAIFFYGLLTPIGLVFRLIGRDPFHLLFDRQALTYWQPYTQKRSMKDYFHQF